MHPKLRLLTICAGFNRLSVVGCLLETANRHLGTTALSLSPFRSQRLGRKRLATSPTAIYPMPGRRLKLWGASAVANGLERIGYRQTIIAQDTLLNCSARTTPTTVMGQYRKNNDMKIDFRRIIVPISGISLYSLHSINGFLSAS